MRGIRMPRVSPVVGLGMAVVLASIGACQSSASSQPTPSPTPAAVGLITFTVEDDPNGSASDIWVLGSDGSNPHALTPRTPGTRYEYPSWTPHGDRILYDVEDTDGSTIWSMKPDGSDVRRIGPATFGGKRPVMSSDGTRIAFDTEAGIGIAQADGSGAVAITSRATDDDDFGPAFSPDGHSIAFSRKDAIWVVGTDGTGIRSLTDPALEAVTPRWSPAGLRILWNNPGGDSTVGRNVHVINADGTNHVNLTPRPELSDDPDWSPNGSRIVFVWFKPGNAWALAIMTAEGINPTSIWQIPAEPMFPIAPRWQPAG